MQRSCIQAFLFLVPGTSGRELPARRRGPAAVCIRFGPDCQVRQPSLQPFSISTATSLVGAVLLPNFLTWASSKKTSKEHKFLAQQLWPHPWKSWDVRLLVRFRDVEVGTWLGSGSMFKCVASTLSNSVIFTVCVESGRVEELPSQIRRGTGVLLQQPTCVRLHVDIKCVTLQARLVQTGLELRLKPQMHRCHCCSEVAPRRLRCTG